ncbi:MAG: ATP-binding cassette domain-containing protein [Brevinematales bacterium]|nr:ATP-binding cassette domain-containing protein [Brevinematales bacterium]
MKKKYFGVEALKGIAMQIHEGETVGLLGPNGAGKTTLVKSILGLVKFDEGNIRVMGYSVPEDLKLIKMFVGVVPQENNLDSDISVYENLLIYGEIFGLKPKKLKPIILSLLDELKMLDKMNENVENLSGGMKRKLIIARSLINDPKILILDEPTVGLDPEIRKSIWDKIIHLKEKGKTILLTTHYLDEAQALCDRIYIIDNGIIIENGSPEELISRHLPAYAIEIFPRIQLPEELQSIKKIEFVNYLILFHQDPNYIKHMIRSRGAKKIHVRLTTLEDVFLFLTGKRLEDKDEVGTNTEAKLYSMEKKLV